MVQYSISTIIVSIVVGVLMLSAGIYLYASGSTVYSYTNTSYMDEATAKRLSANIATISGETEKSIDGNIITNTQGNDLLGAFKPLKQLWAFNSVRKDVQNIIQNSLFFIPSWIKVLIFAIISIIVGIAVVSFIRGYPGN